MCHTTQTRLLESMRDLLDLIEAKSPTLKVSDVAKLGKWQKSKLYHRWEYDGRTFAKVSDIQPKSMSWQRPLWATSGPGSRPVLRYAVGGCLMRSTDEFLDVPEERFESLRDAKKDAMVRMAIPGLIRKGILIQVAGTSPESARYVLQT